MSSADLVGAPHSPSLYDEQLYYAVLKQGNPSESRVAALAALGLRHLSKAAETWAALRKVLMEQTDLDAPANRTLWYVMDSLMKAAPHIFVPLISPRLLEYTIQQLPWELAGHRGQTRLWFETLVLSWEKVLPQRLYGAIRQHAVQSRSGAELHGLLDAAQGGADDGTPASTSDLQRLQEAWDAVRYLGEEEASKLAFLAFPATPLEELVGRGGSTPAAVAAAGTSRATGGRAAPARSDATDSASDAEGDDDYAPTYVPGAQPRELPKLDLPKQRKRREGRRRPREDDLGM